MMTESMTGLRACQILETGMVRYLELHVMMLLSPGNKVVGTSRGLKGLVAAGMNQHLLMV